MMKKRSREYVQRKHLIISDSRYNKAQVSLDLLLEYKPATDKKTKVKVNKKKKEREDISLTEKKIKKVDSKE